MGISKPKFKKKIDLNFFNIKKKKFYFRKKQASSHKTPQLFIYSNELLLIGQILCLANGNLLSFCLDVAQGHMKGAPNETRTHS